MKSYFVCRLIPPPPTFVMDMTELGAAIMRQQSSHWRSLLEQGAVLIVGLVLAPSGGWGPEVVETETMQDVCRLSDDGPAVTSGLMSFEVGAMSRAFVRS